MPNILEIENIKLSVIIPYWQQREFLLDIITNLEYSLAVNYEVIVLGDRNLLNLDLADILNYLKAQGHQLLCFENSLKTENIYHQAISQAQGELIIWLPYPVIFSSEGLQEAIEILDNNLEVVGVDGNGHSGSIFRKLFWENEIILKENVIISEQFEWEFQFKNNLKNYNIYKVYKNLYDLRINHILLTENLRLEVKELPLVSVCIPTYNGEQFIAEAISSVLSQTYSAIELIISDDQSQDYTLAIAQSFQKQTSIPISILTHHPLGLAENSNFCIDQSQGKYIKFLYQDDILKPNCIEKMVDLAEIDPDIGLVFSPREMFFLNQDDIDLDLMAVYQEFANLHQSWLNLNSIQWGTELLADPNLWQHPINKIGEPSTVLLRKSIFERIAGFDPQLNQLVDLDLWWRILGHFKVGFVKETLSLFRLHSQQKTYQNMQENQAMDINFYDKIYSHPDYDFLPAMSRQQAFFIYNSILTDLSHPLK